jgi:hypothetical protein
MPCFENRVPDRLTPRVSEDFAHGDKSVLPPVPLPIDHPTICFSMSTDPFWRRKFGSSGPKIPPYRPGLQLMIGATKQRNLVGLGRARAPKQHHD